MKSLKNRILELEKTTHKPIDRCAILEAARNKALEEINRKLAQKQLGDVDHDSNHTEETDSE